MKCALILPVFFALDGHPSIGHATAFSTHGKYTLYVFGPPPPMYTPLFYGRNIPVVFSMWPRREYVAIALPHSLQLTLVLFCSQKVAPPPVAFLLYDYFPCWTQYNPRVNIISLVLPSFVWSLTLSNILTISSRVTWTQMGLRLAIWPSSV